jgi:hypothetical protein
MNTKDRAVVLAVTILFLAAGEALARRVNHSVTPANIDKLPFKASVKVKDVGKFKEFEITITGIVGNPTSRPPSAPGGWVIVIGHGTDEPIAVKRTTSAGMGTFTFQIAPEQLEKAHFFFGEDEADWNRPFPNRGDVYEFELKNFAGKK